MRLYAIYDRKAEEYIALNEAVNDGVASRMFKSWLKDNPYPEDFQILFVGSFDRRSGLLSPVAMPAEVVPGQLELELVKDTRAELETR